MVLFTPSCWIQLHFYSKVWDVKLNSLMKDHNFREFGRYTAKLGDYTIWISNHPYGSFHPEFDYCRPSRATMLKAQAKLEADRYK